jgi:hypothetical protein
MKPIAFVVFFAALPTVAAAGVTVMDAWARASILANRPGAVYLTLESDTADSLTALATPAADQVILHGSETDDNGVSRMVHVEVLDLVPDTRVSFSPGEMHVMLVGLTEKLEEGSTFPLTLSFENAEDITVDVQVLGIAATGPEDAR